MEAADTLDMSTIIRQPGTRASNYMNSSDDLLARVKCRDDEFFRLMFARYARPLVSFIYDMVGERELADELTQETFVRAYKGMSTLRDDAKISSWLFGIAKNVVRESLRARRREQQQVDIDSYVGSEMEQQGAAPDENLLNQELNRVIHNALGALGEDKRMVFSLRVLQRRSYEEIAEITGHSVAKLKTDLHRARVELQRRLSRYVEGSR